VDTQLILYDSDGSSILLFHDNVDNSETVDLSKVENPYDRRSEIVWEAQTTGTYFIKVRTTACDEDEDNYCDGPPDAGYNSPDGVGLYTDYTISLQLESYSLP
jgi:hypothetical protein